MGSGTASAQGRTATLPPTPNFLWTLPSIPSSPHSLALSLPVARSPTRPPSPSLSRPPTRLPYFPRSLRPSHPALKLPHSAVRPPRVFAQRWSCDKLPDDTSPWVLPRLQPDSLAVGVFVLEEQLLTAAFIANSTWLAPLKNKAFYSDRPFDLAGTIPLLIERSDGGVHMATLRGLADLRVRFPMCEWFTMATVDSYVDIDAAMQMLSSFDSSRGWWLASYRRGPFRFDAPMDEAAMRVNHSMFPRRRETYMHSAGVWMVSRPVVQSYVNALPRFEATHNAQPCSCPIIVIGQLLSLLGYELTAIPSAYASMTWGPVQDELPHRWAKGPPCQAGESARWESMSKVSFAFFYEVPPRRVLALHHRALHSRLDRMLVASDFYSISEWMSTLQELHASIEKWHNSLLKQLCENPRDTAQVGRQLRVHRPDQLRLALLRHFHRFGRHRRGHAQGKYDAIKLRSLIETYMRRIARTQLLVSLYGAMQSYLRAPAAAPSSHTYSMMVGDLPDLTIWGTKLSSCEDAKTAFENQEDIDPSKFSW